LSHSTYGNPPGALATQVREAVAILDAEGADFEYDGEMSPDVALDMELRVVFPFCRLTGPANILIMPGLHAAAISSQIFQKLGGGTVIGPLLTGLSRAVQIVPINANDATMVNFATMAAHDSVIIANRESASRTPPPKPKSAAKKKQSSKK
jgi:malate dehydrogenase (oxaloacetate-decarboxylating)(NADP+)